MELSPTGGVKNALVLAISDYTTGWKLVLAFRFYQTDSKHGCRWLRTFTRLFGTFIVLFVRNCDRCRHGASPNPSGPTAQSATAGLPVTANSGRRLAAMRLTSFPRRRIGGYFCGAVDLPLQSDPADLTWTRTLRQQRNLGQLGQRADLPQ